MLDTVDAELTAFRGSMIKSPAFAKFLGNPTLSRKENVAKVKNTVCLYILSFNTKMTKYK